MDFFKKNLSNSIRIHSSLGKRSLVQMQTCWSFRWVGSLETWVSCVPHPFQLHNFAGTPCLLYWTCPVMETDSFLRRHHLLWRGAPSEIFMESSGYNSQHSQQGNITLWDTKYFIYCEFLLGKYIVFFLVLYGLTRKSLKTPVVGWHCTFRSPFRIKKMVMWSIPEERVKPNHWPESY